MKRIKKTALCLAVLLTVTFLMGSMSRYSFADPMAGDGKYEVEFDSDMPSMGLSAFENKEKKVIVEKIGGNCYLTVSVNSGVVSEFKMLKSSMKVGETVQSEGNIERHCFTITEQQLYSVFHFSVYVTAMGQSVEFTVDPKMDTAKRLGEADNLSERPALFVPEMEVSVGNAEVEKGSYYVIPNVKATLGNEILDVDVRAFFMENKKKVEIEIQDRKLLFSKAGEYRLVFRAESDKYKTSEGNNTYCETEIVLTSKIGAGVLAGFEDKNGVVPEGGQLQANILKDGKNFEKVSLLMKEYSEKFQVLHVTLYDENGKELELKGKIQLFLRAKDSFDRKELKVFFLKEDGSLQEYEKDNFGRYISIETKSMGTYVLLEEGVPFRMPMWGYALILGSALLSFAIGLSVYLVLKKKKR